MADHKIATASTRGRRVGWFLVRSHAERVVVLLGAMKVVARSSSLLPGANKDHLRSLAYTLPVLMKEARRLAQRRALSKTGICRPRRDPGAAPKLKPARRTVTGKFVKILGAVLDHGLAAVDGRLRRGAGGPAPIASGDVILNRAGRGPARSPVAPPSITTPDALRLKIEPAGRLWSLRTS